MTIVSSNYKWGNTEIKPAEPIVVGEKKEWKIIYTCGQYSIKAGMVIRIAIPLCWTVPTKDKSKAGAIEVFTFAKIAIRYEIRRHRYIYIYITGGRLCVGDKIYLIYGFKDAGGPGSTAQTLVTDSKITFETAVDPTGVGNFILFEKHPTVKILPNEPKYFNVVIPSITHINKPLDVKISVVDKYGNPVASFKEDILIETTLKATYKSKQRIKIINFASHKINITFKELGIGRIKVTSVDGKIQGTSNPCRVFGEEKQEISFNKQIYWGDVHGHSTISDGVGSPDYFYRYARYIAHLDFAALTDHDYEVHHSWYERKEQVITKQQWREIKNRTKKYYELEKFITFNAYEWTGRPWGDRCIYFLGGDPKMISCNDKDGSTPNSLYSSLKKIDALVIPHTTCSGFMGGEWNIDSKKLEKVMEIYSMHGSCEFEGGPRTVLNSVKKQYFRDALAKGLKLGVIGSGDNHLTQPGNPHLIPGPYSSLRYSTGLAAVWCDGLTRKDIFQSLRERYCYATTGARIILDFQINGVRMGEEIKVKAKESPEIKVYVAGTDRIKLLEIIRFGEVAYSISSQKMDFSLKWKDTAIFLKSCYYYIRLIQEDGEMAWSSPIWVNREI